MVRDDQPVQGTHELHWLAGTGDNLFTFGESISHIGIESVADKPGIPGVGRVQMCLAPENPIWMALPDEGRVDRRLLRYIFFLHRKVDARRLLVLGRRVRRQDRD